jgi:PII-like signaling protein
MHNQEGQGATKLHLPVRIEFIDSPEVVDAVLPSLCEIVRDGLIDPTVSFTAAAGASSALQSHK